MKNNKDEFSQEEGNLQVVDTKKESASLANANKNSNNKIVIGTLNVFTEPLKRRHKKHYKESLFHLIADVVLVFIIVSLIGLVFYVKNSQNIVEIVIEAKKVNEKIISGREETFVLDFNNHLAETITDVRIAVVSPDVFVLNSVVPENNFDNTTNTFSLGDLCSGANGEIKVTGLVLGEVGSNHSINFIMSYKNGKKEEITYSSIFFNIEGTMLQVTSEFPGEVYVGDNLTSDLKIINKGENIINSLLIEFNGDVVIADNIGYQHTGNIIEVAEADKDEQIILPIHFKSYQDMGVKTFDINVYIKNKDELYKQLSLPVKINVREPGLKINLNSSVFNFQNGAKIPFELKYENTEKGDISDLNLAIGKIGDSVQVKNVVSENFKYQNQQFTKANLVLGETGQVNFDAYVNYFLPKVNQTLNLPIKVSYIFDGKAIEYIIYSNSLKMLSNLQVKSAGYYYSEQGDQLGLGPIPPIVGIPTSYWIIWEVENSGNKLSDFTMSADLASGIAWNNKKSVLSGNLFNGAVSKTIAWELDSVSEKNGVYKVSFEVTVLPDENDAGKIKNILNNIKVSATDTFCGQKINKNINNITTDLKFDKLLIGKGIVQAE